MGLAGVWAVGVASAFVVAATASGAQPRDRFDAIDAYWVGHGALIAFYDQRRTGQLWLTRADGSSSRPVGTRSASVSSTVSPSGRLVAEVEAFETTDLTLAEVGGKVIKRFRLPGRDPLFTEPAWAPDESAVAVDDDDLGIYVATLAGRFRALVGGVRPAWSPDSRHIAFVYALHEERGPHLAVISRDGRDRWLLVRNLVMADCCVRRPVWSPDGRSIAIASPFAAQGSRTIPPPQRWGIYVVRRDGSGFRRVAVTPWIEAGDITPAWSPDGRYISFADNRGILVVPATGGRLRRVTALGSFSETSWAPASQIVFTHRGNIYKVAPGLRPTLLLR